MANVYQNPNTYTQECLASLLNEMVISKHVSRKYESKFATVGEYFKYAGKKVRLVNLTVVVPERAALSRVFA